jgi:hypothetical protein
MDDEMNRHFAEEHLAVINNHDSSHDSQYVSLTTFLFVAAGL